MMTDAEKFLNALGHGMPPDERLIICRFKGDPATVDGRLWRPYDWKPGVDLPIPSERFNAYVTVASFGRWPEGGWRRRTEAFAAGRALMIDDVGRLDGTNSARVDINTIRFRPSAIIETSPGNCQYFYILREPLRDQELFKGLIDAFIARKLGGNDPGQAGTNRVGRLPGFANGKEKYGGFTTRLVELNDRRFTVGHLLTAFNLKLVPPPEIAPLKHGEETERRAAYNCVEKWLRKQGYLKRKQPNMGGWIEMRCPWIDNHSDGANTGAAIRIPSPENQWVGAFRCHHAGCADRHWRDLNDYIDDLIAEDLDSRGV